MHRASQPDSFVNWFDKAQYKYHDHNLRPPIAAPRAVHTHELAQPPPKPGAHPVTAPSRAPLACLSSFASV